MIIRSETSQDVLRTRKLVRSTFADVPHSNGSEGAIIDALRTGGALAVSLVAEQDGAVVGHVAFSAVRIDGQSVDWYGLGPLAVRPDYQRQGVGSALVEAGIREIKALGAAGCVVLGDPAYYRRFGFRVASTLRFPEAPPEYFQRVDFCGDGRQGVVVYHSSFYGI